MGLDGTCIYGANAYGFEISVHYPPLMEILDTRRDLDSLYANGSARSLVQTGLLAYHGFGIEVGVRRSVFPQGAFVHPVRNKCR